MTHHAERARRHARLSIWSMLVVVLLLPVAALSDRLAWLFLPVLVASFASFAWAMRAAHAMRLHRREQRGRGE